MSLRDNAKRLRSVQTDAEQRLWYHLRAHRFLGLKFRRQKPIGSYIVDFICHEKSLVIELDGGQHSEQSRYDDERDEWLRHKGYRVLRFWNNEVMQEFDAVLERIRLAALSPAPLPQAGEGNPPSPLTPLPQAGEGNEPKRDGEEEARETGMSKQSISPLPFTGEG
jgi:very-short-patch-repair endonuclease